MFNTTPTTDKPVKRFWCCKYKFVIPEYMCDDIVCRYYILNGGYCCPKDMDT